MTYLSLSLFLAALWWFAFREASNDADTIAKDRAVYHIPSWFRRAALMMSLMVTSTCFIDLDLTSLLGFLLMSAGGFSALFRAKLNSLRGKDWRYVSPSNWYDYTYLMATGAWCWKPKRWTWRNWWAFMRAQHPTLMDLRASYMPQVHRAGTLAYIAEAIAFAGGLYLVLKP